MKLCDTCPAIFQREVAEDQSRACTGESLRRTPWRPRMEDAGLLQAVARLRERGYSIREIAQALQVSKSWVHKATKITPDKKKGA
jgi:hypothetical protein